MKVVVYQDYLRSGGTESQSLFLVEQFGDRGDECTLLTNRPGGDLFEYIEEKGIEHLSLQHRDLGLNWWCPGLIKAIHSLDPDLIILMGRNANCNGLKIMRGFPKIPVVASYRTARRLPVAYKRTLQSASLVVCNSIAAKTRLNAVIPASTNVEVHRNPCLRTTELRVASVQPDRIKEDFKPSHRLLYTAAFVKGKNHEAALFLMRELLKTFPDVVLYLIGSGPLFEKTKEKITELDLERNVKLLGYRKDVGVFYQFCDLAISTSLEESLPNALIESQYAGLPVVAFDESGVKECFIPNVSGVLIERGNIDDFVSTVGSLISDESKLEAMSVAARQYAQSEYDPNLRFAAFYDSVLRLAKHG